MSGEIPDNKTTNLENDADDEGTGEVAEFSDELTANISNDALASAQKLLTDLEKSRSDFLYLRAEFENYKKLDKQLSKEIQLAVKDLIDDAFKNHK